MKKRQLQKKFTYESLGFPVMLLNVPMIEVRGEWAPDIDLNVLQKAVLHALATRTTALTGNHVRFIRTWFAMTATDFGRLFGVSHAAVLKWEKTGNRSAKISLTTERDIRLLILYRILKKATDFHTAFWNVHQLDLKHMPRPVEVKHRELIAM